MVAAEDCPGLGGQPRQCGAVSGAGRRGFRLHHQSAPRVRRRLGGVKLCHELAPRVAAGAGQFVPAVSGGNRGQTGPGAPRPADSPGFGSRARVWARLRQRQAVHPAVGSDAAVADAADGVCPGRAGAGRPGHRGADRGLERSAAEDTRVSDRPEPFAEGLQRGDLPAGHRQSAAMPGERLLALRGGAEDAGDRQPQGLGQASGLVRSGAQPASAVVRRALRNGNLAGEALHAPSQGQDRAGHRLRERQRLEGPAFCRLGRTKPPLDRVGDGGGGHADPRHHA